MAARPISDEVLRQALDAFEAAGGNYNLAARQLGLNRMTFRHRLEEARRRLAVDTAAVGFWTFPPFIEAECRDGVVIVASDAHVWPLGRSVSALGLIAITREIQPDFLVANGDFVDGARTNRHDPHGWNRRPGVKDEIDGAQRLLHDWSLAAPRARRVYTIGNHDLNFERRLVTAAKEFEGMPGLRLSEHFTGWEFAWSLRLNWQTPGATMIKHRFQSSGVHAAYNATLKGGVHTVNGHTHLLEVKPWGDYRGRRYGVQTGCLTDPNGPQFEYHEQHPVPHCEGFAVLTYRDGQLLHPELAEVIDGRCWFRGRTWGEG